MKRDDSAPVTLWTRGVLAVAVCLAPLSMASAADAPPGPPINRHALVSRHDIVWPSLTGAIPLGNGNFAFNADGTGLETFAGNTMSHWCWHSFPLPEGTTAQDVKPWAALESGRLKGATTPPPLLKDWLYFNPHPLNLGRLGFIDAEGKRINLTDCVSTDRRLDLWSGLLTSKFTYRGEPVEVETCVDPKRDIVAVKITSPLLQRGVLRVRLDFPSPSAPGSTDPRTGRKPWVGDFENPANHSTEVVNHGQDRLGLKRTVNATSYWVRLAARGVEKSAPVAPNQIDLDTAGSPSYELTCFLAADAPTASAVLPDFEDIRLACAAGWQKFWQGGGAIDLSGSKDPRWMELERRIVLSQYELAVQSAGDQFPAEAGLTGYDPWSAKFHLEMTWWHVAHYALWNRWPMAEKALDYYRRNIPYARAIAQNFDYQGLMWPKSTGPDGINDGYPKEMLLLWKQPHPIFFAELEYRLQPTKATLEKWKDVVLGTAAMMADFPTLDPQTGVYSLVPVWPATETRTFVKDPIFELGYWRWALLAAQTWRERLGMSREVHWDEVVNHLAPLPVQNGLYVFRADSTDTYTLRAANHLDQIGIFAMLPPFPGLDFETAHRTVLEIAKGWNWDKIWGWDFPYMAMGAARVGEPATAIEALFNPSRRNFYDERGLNLPGGYAYLPGNGGLLYATAMMAAGWDGAPKRHAPGFPDDGSWTVRWEGLNPAP